MSTPKLVRPQKVTFAGWLIMIGAGVIILSAFERISGLHTIESQKAAAELLSKPPGDGLGLSVDGYLEIIRYASLVSAACATAAGILGFQVLKGSRSARLAVVILSVPLLIASLPLAGFMAAIVAASALMLYTQPARDWFAGRAPAPVEPKPSEPTAFGGPGSPVATSSPVERSSSVEPVETTPSSQISTLPQAQDRPSSINAAPTAKRPSPVLVACLLTWVWCALLTGVMAVSLAVVAADANAVMDAMREQEPELTKQGITENMLISTIYVAGSIVIVWCLVAAALAILTFRRINWARITLIVSASVSSLLCLVGLLANPVLILPLASCVLCAVMLLRPEVKVWFARG